MDKGVDGIAVTLAKPDALSGNVRAAVQAGIPVVALNAGSDVWRSMGCCRTSARTRRSPVRRPASG